jgi:hypothetical protein
MSTNCSPLLFQRLWGRQRPREKAFVLTMHSDISYASMTLLALPAYLKSTEERKKAVVMAKNIGNNLCLIHRLPAG